MTRALVALLALSLVGCGLSSPTNRLNAQSAATVKARSLTSESLYPTQVGWQWRYQTKQRAGDAPERPGQEQVFTIVSVENASDSVHAVMERRFGDRQAPSTLIVRNAEGVTLSRYQHPEEGSLTIMKWPLIAGANWPGRTWTQAKAQETIRYIATESVQVPAGTFEAVRFEHHIAYQAGHTDKLIYWYAPRMGMVKAIEGLMMDWGQGPTLYQATCELTSYGPASPSVGL